MWLLGGESTGAAVGPPRIGRSCVSFPHGRFIHELLHKVSLALGSERKMKGKKEEVEKGEAVSPMPDSRRLNAGFPPQTFQIVTAEYWRLAFLIMPPLFYLHPSPRSPPPAAGVFSSSPPHPLTPAPSPLPSLSLTLAARQTCPRQGRLSACHVPQRDAASLIMRR